MDTAARLPFCGPQRSRSDRVGRRSTVPRPRARWIAAALALGAITGADVPARAEPGETRWDLGVATGAGRISGARILSGTVWAGARQGDLALAIQAPLRLDLDAGGVRSRDWDERADFGRALRFIRYGESLEVGVLADVTFGEGTLLRRYHNGIDEDHHRTGARAHVEVGGLAITALADQVLAAPVLGLRAAQRLGDVWILAPAMVLDTAAPVTLTGGADDTARLHAQTEALPAYGAELTLALTEAPSQRAAVYAALNRVDQGSPGAHLGLSGGAQLNDTLRLDGRLEAMWLGRGYDWSYFDTGYLIDRWRPKAPRTADRPAAPGGRAELSATLSDALVAGVAYGDAGGGERSELSAWLLLPTERLTLSAFYRHRDPVRRRDLLDPRDALAAVAVRFALSEPLWLTMTVARLPRVSGEGPDAAYRGQTEMLIGLEAAWAR